MAEEDRAVSATAESIIAAEQEKKRALKEFGQDVFGFAIWCEALAVHSRHILQPDDIMVYAPSLGPRIFLRDIVAPDIRTMWRISIEMLRGPFWAANFVLPKINGSTTVPFILPIKVKYLYIGGTREFNLWADDLRVHGLSADFKGILHSRQGVIPLLRQMKNALGELSNEITLFLRGLVEQKTQSQAAAELVINAAYLLSETTFSFYTQVTERMACEEALRGLDREIVSMSNALKATKGSFKSKQLEAIREHAALTRAAIAAQLACKMDFSPLGK